MNEAPCVIGIDLSRRKLDIALLIDGKNEKRIMKANVMVAQGVGAKSGLVASIPSPGAASEKNGNPRTKPGQINVSPSPTPELIRSA